MWVCVLRNGIRTAAEPSSTALTESRSWLEPRQLDEGHRLERQRRCGKNIHNYVPLNAVAAWIIDTPRPALRSRGLRSDPRFAITSLFRLFGRGGSSRKFSRSRNWHKVPHRPSYHATLAIRIFLFSRIDAPRDRETAIPEQSSPRVTPLFAACAAACVINVPFHPLFNLHLISNVTRNI